MSALLTSIAIKRHVLTLLGSPVVCVELTDEQLDICIDKALEIYGDNRPLFKKASLSVVSTQAAYVLTTYGRGLIDVMYEDPLLITAELSELDLWRYNQFNTLSTDPGDYYMAKMWRNEVKRAVGSDFDWDYDPNTHTLYVSGLPSSASQVTYVYAESPTLTTVPEADDGYIREGALAMAKLILGRIRNKFRGIPGAESTIEMDGADLIAEGTAEWDTLEEELVNKSGSRVPPIRG